MPRSSNLGFLPQSIPAASTTISHPTVENEERRETWKKQAVSLLIVGTFVVAGIVVGLWAGMQNAFESSN